MNHEVGPDGHILIDDEIREQLGIKPSWLAQQRLVNGRVEITFAPPRNNWSPTGAHARHSARAAPPEESWEDAWAEAAVEKELELLEEWRSGRNPA